MTVIQCVPALPRAEVLRRGSGAQEVDASAEEREAAATDWQCRVCLAQECNAVMVACGHVLCATCAAEVNQRCPFCRKPSAFRAIFR